MEEYILIKEAKILMRIEPKLFYELIRSGELPSKKEGGRRFVSKSGIQKWESLRYVCRGCSMPVPRVANGIRRQWCSMACRARTLRETWPSSRIRVTPTQFVCERCGVHVEAKSGTRSGKFCSQECRLFYEMKGPFPFTCIECGATGVCDRPRRFCSDTCRWRVNRRNRAALKRGGAATGEEAVGRDWIIQRDGRKCHICSRAIGTKPWPHPESLSLDHIVPLSKGGAHSVDNLRPAHLGCNARRWNSGAAQQLLPFTERTA